MIFFFFLPDLTGALSTLREDKGPDFLPSSFRMQAVISLNLRAVAGPDARRVDATTS